MDERPQSRIVILKRGPHNYILYYERYVIKGERWLPKTEFCRGPKWGETEEQARKAAKQLSLTRGLNHPAEMRMASQWEDYK